MGDVYTNPPQSRNEAILESIIEGTEYTDPPQSRIEDLLLDLKEVVEEGSVVANPDEVASDTLTKLKVKDTVYSVPSGGGGGTSDYTQLSNKPQINGTTLVGNQSASDLGLVAAEAGKGLSENDYTDADAAIVAGVTDALAGKVDKVQGMGLSENDYTDADKAIVGGVTSALADKVDKNGTDSLMTAAEHTKLSGIASGAQVNTIESISVNGSAVTPDEHKNVALTVMTNAVNDLVNYYKKSETYTQAEVNNLIGAITTLNIEVVQELPTTDISTTTIYLVPKSSAQTQNTYDEYICLDATTTPATWEKIGDTEIDLTNYVQKSSTAGLLKNDGSVDTNTYAQTANAYLTGDTAETDLQDDDYVPFYDSSATGKRKTLWSNIKAKLKAFFDTLYATISSVTDINAKIPSGASSSNKMATASDVNAKISWVDAEKSVKKNLFNYNAWKGVHVQNGTGTFTNNGIDLTATTNGAYTDFAASNFPIGARIPVKEGDKIKITWDMGANSALGNVMLFPNGIPDSSTWVSVENTTKKLEYTATSGVTFVTFRVGVNTAPNVAHYKNIMVTYDDVPVDVTKYVSYVPDNTELVDWSSYAVTGAVNLCLPTSANSGIVTRNADNTFTVNGTLSEATVYELGRDCFPTLEIGTTYKLVGCPSSGKPNGTNLAIRPVSTSTGAKSESGNGVTWEVTNATTASAFSYLYLAAGTYDNVVFKPMLTPRLDATYADYVKGAMTNEELTKNFPTAYSTSDLVFTNCTYVSGGYAKVGKLCVVNIRVLTDADMTGKDISITGFPSYSGSLNNKNIVPCNALNMSDDSNTNYYSAIGYTGNMNVHNSSNNIVPSKEYAISATYLCG